LCTSSNRTIILLHAVHDCPGGRTAAIARHVSFAQITWCFLSAFWLFMFFTDDWWNKAIHITSKYPTTRNASWLNCCSRLSHSTNVYKIDLPACLRGRFTCSQSLTSRALILAAVYTRGTEAWLKRCGDVIGYNDIASVRPSVRQSADDAESSGEHLSVSRLTKPVQPWCPLRAVMGPFFL